MKLRNLIVALAATVIFIPALMQAVAETSIIVIDQAKIMRDSKAGKDIAAKLKTISEQVNNELQPTADALGKEQKSLNDKIRPLNQAAIRQDTALLERIKSFEKRAQEFEAKRQTRAAELELTRRAAWSKFFEALGPALESVIAESNADVVLERSSAVHASDNIDRTAAVIAKMDATTPSIAVTKQSLPKNPQ